MKKNKPHIKEKVNEEIGFSGKPEKNISEPQGFPVVGIGASAGGLAAFEAFFSGMPAGVDPGMASGTAPGAGS